MYLHRDQDMLAGFPQRSCPDITDGESSPAFADLDGDNRNELIVGSSNGFVHAYTYDPATAALRAARLAGPRRRARLRLRARRRARLRERRRSPTTTAARSSPRSPSATPTTTACPRSTRADLEGKVYGWDAERPARLRDRRRTRPSRASR